MAPSYMTDIKIVFLKGSLSLRSVKHNVLVLQKNNNKKHSIVQGFILLLQSILNEIPCKIINSLNIQSL